MKKKQTRKTKDSAASRRSDFARRLPLIAILTVAVIGALTLRDYLSFEALRDNREALLAFRDANYLLTAGVFIAAYIVIVSFSLPGATIATLTGGFLFATFPGALFNVTGATIGATAIFTAARWGFGERLGAKLEGSEGAVKKIKDGIDENQWSMLFLIRLVPAVPFFVANLVPSFMQVPTWRFVLSTFLGIIPGSVVYTSVGAGLGEVFARGESPDLGIIFEPQILLPILGLCALALLPVAVKAVRGKKAHSNVKRIKTDVCIIGAGSGGLSVAAGAAQMGAKVVLIEGHKMGGDCLNFGCVPSKALIAAAKQAHAMTTGKAYGVAPVQPEVDYAAAKNHVRKAIATIEPHDSQERFEGLGVQVIRKWGRFISRREVQAGNTVIKARRFVISTGSSPLVPPIPGIGKVKVHTNETIFDLRERPEHLLVIGGGPIGMEMAQAHVRLGSKVTVIEGLKALGKDDPEMASVVLKKLRAEGVEIVENATAANIVKTDRGITVETTDGASYSGTHLLMAVGRKVNIEKLNLDKARIAHDRAVKVNARLRSVSNRRVYAIGDAAGGLQFTHVAGYHAGVIIRSMLFGLRSKARTDHIPWATYTDPELAQVGLTEAEATEKFGSAAEIVRFPFSGNDRAIAEGKTDGLIKVMVVKGRPVGASIVGQQAGELIGVWALAIANRLKIGAVAGMVAPYPTLGEASKRVAGAYFGPRLFENPTVKRVVGFVQRWIP